MKILLESHIKTPYNPKLSTAFVYYTEFPSQIFFPTLVYFVKVSIPGCKWQDELYIKLE